ncbi:hypothetical protein ABZ372_50115 [Streptomyces sp. NPDC005921]|uniref:hypothetical protein n=1 Tax=Streptomyces sp. NPDC005827 TaxID=3157070 RepID=UPI0033CB9FDF
MARYTGTRVLGFEDPRLSTGTGTYVDNLVRPGMPRACLVRGPVARARGTGTDMSRALRRDGVHAVFTAQDPDPAEREQQCHTLNGRDNPGTPRPPITGGEVRIVGDPVVMVVAVDRCTPQDAPESVVVAYEELRPAVDYAIASEPAAFVHATHHGGLVGGSAGRPPAGPVPVFDRALARGGRDRPPAVLRSGSDEAPRDRRRTGRRRGKDDHLGGRPVPARGPLSSRPAARRRRTSAVRGEADSGGGFGQKALPQQDDMCFILPASGLPTVLKRIGVPADNGRDTHREGTARELVTCRPAPAGTPPSCRCTPTSPSRTSPPGSDTDPWPRPRAR